MMTLRKGDYRFESQTYPGRERKSPTRMERKRQIRRLRRTIKTLKQQRQHQQQQHQQEDFIAVDNFD